MAEQEAVSGRGSTPDSRGDGRLRPVDHRLGDAAGGDGADVLTAEQRQLLGLLAEGLSLSEAAARLALGVRTTTEAILAATRST